VRCLLSSLNTRYPVRCAMQHRASRQVFESCGPAHEPLPFRLNEDVPWRPMFKLQ
jgi:hypothetical protein